MSVCQGCGTELPPSRGNRARKWCSERCRKGQYAGTCVDCGAPTNGYNGPGTAADRCAGCFELFQAGRPGLERAEEKSACQHPVRISADAILHAIRTVGTGNGAEYEVEARRRGLPSVPTVIKCFGGWNEAVRSAGLEPAFVVTRNYRFTSAEDCARAVLHVGDMLGNLPSYNEYRAYRKLEEPSLPSGPLIRVRCDTWVKALRMATALADASKRVAA